MKSGIDDSAATLAEHAGVLEEIHRGVAAANAKLSRVEQIKYVKILPVFWQPGGDELTPTAKLRRRPIADKYAAGIDQIYDGARRS